MSILQNSLNLDTEHEELNISGSNLHLENVQDDLSKFKKLKLINL